MNYYKLLCASALFILTACNGGDDNLVTPTPTSPFDETTGSDNLDRNKIVVISDLHLGNDLSYSENVAHLDRLVQFLQEVRNSKTVKELVLAGDVFDEWYIPTRLDTYDGKTAVDFISKTAKANQKVFEQFKGIISDGRVKLTYIPGNHDMGFKATDVNAALPGVNQARDDVNKYGVGTYHPEGYPEIAIEHGHRYDFFSSMCQDADPETPGTILPPGYFFARIAANSFTNPTTLQEATKVQDVKLNIPLDAEQNSKHIYYENWEKVMNNVIYVKEDLDEKIFTTNIGGFTKKYSINDILPHNNLDGSIEMNLYNDKFTQQAWDDQLTYNNVPVMTNIDKAIRGSLNTAFIDSMSYVQYFQNDKAKERIVIFGHTHAPMILPFTNSEGKPCLYGNSGTWEDQKTRDKSQVIPQDELKMNFIVIYPKANNIINVDLLQYKNGKHTPVDSKEIEL